MVIPLNFISLRFIPTKRIRWLSFRCYSSKSSEKQSARNDQNNDKRNDNNDKNLNIDNYKNSMKKDYKLTTDEIKSKLNRLLLPKVPSTDYIPQKEIETEGLFAGYKPLFLGNPPLESPNYSSTHILNRLFASLNQIRNSTDMPDNKAIEIDIHGLLKTMKKDSMDWWARNNSENLMIPWDASISGMIYNDRSFKNIPRSIVSKLRPFQIFKTDDEIKKFRKHDIIRLKFHNISINDKSELVDLFQHVNEKNAKHSDSSGIQDLVKSKKKYEIEMMKYAYKHQFIKADQTLFKIHMDTLNKLVSKEFYKITKLRIDSEFSECYLPLYIYIDRSIQSRCCFQRYVRKRMVTFIDSILVIYKNKNSKVQTSKIKQKIMAKIDKIIDSLTTHMPSNYITDRSIDCILHTGPIPNFGRIYWLRKARRHNIFWGKNIDMDFVPNLSTEYKVTRTGVRYMRYPANLNWKSFDDACSG